MSYFTLNELAGIASNPARVRDLYQAHWKQFGTDLGGADQGRSLSFSLKPYGPELNGVQDLPGLLAQPTLACNDYVLLAQYLIADLNYSSGSVQICGFDGGAVGNHCQFFGIDAVSGDTIMCDPTIGLVVHGASYDSVVSGHPVDPSKMVSMLDAYGGSPPAVAFSPIVKTALLDGAYKPSDALYMVRSIQGMLALGNPASWPTPANLSVDLVTA